jgi:hypothetical protein
MLQAVSNLPLVSVTSFPRPSLPSFSSCNFPSQILYSEVLSGFMAILGITFMLSLLGVSMRNIHVANHENKEISRIEARRRMNIDEQSRPEVDKRPKHQKVTFSSRVEGFPAMSQHVEEFPLLPLTDKVSTTKSHDTYCSSLQLRKQSRSFSVKYPPQADTNDRDRRAQSEPSLDPRRYAV